MYQKIKDFLKKLFSFVYNNQEYFVLFALLYGAYKLWEWSLNWTVIDWEAVSSYNSVKLPSTIIGVVALCLITYLYDVISPGNWQRKASEDSLSSAIVLAALIIGLGLILAK